MAINKVWPRWKMALATLSCLAILAPVPTPAIAADISACLITRTDTNPFYVTMQEGARAKAAELGINLKIYAGKVEGDHDSQVAAIESCIADGAKGILITAADSQAIVDQTKKAQDAGLLVIALDNPLDPAAAADATFTTDNLLAGKLIGAWAAATLGDRARDAKVGFLDLVPSQPIVDVSRDQGFMIGFGIDPNDPTKIGDEDDPRIVGNEVTQGNVEGGREAMERLLQKEPDIDVVYVVNESAAVGAHEALRVAGKEDRVLIASVDGSCMGIRSMGDGLINATSQQYPLLMATLGIEAIKKFAETGEKPKPTEGKDFFDTGTLLVTDSAVAGVPSMSVKDGAQSCWGGGESFSCPKEKKCPNGSCGCNNDKIFQ